MEVTSTPAERSFFRALSLLKLYTGLQYHIYSDIRQTSKNLEGGLPKHILEKNTVFWNKGVEIWAFDGSLSVLLFLAERLRCSSCLAERGADVVNRLALETEAVDL